MLFKYFQLINQSYLIIQKFAINLTPKLIKRKHHCYDYHGRIVSK